MLRIRRLSAQLGTKPQTPEGSQFEEWWLYHPVPKVFPHKPSVITLTDIASTTRHNEDLIGAVYERAVSQNGP